jgi:hypothetical protein
MPPLRELQQALRAALLGGDDAGAAALVLDDGLTARARLSIYRHHVFTTLTDALAATFPAVRRLVDPRFFAFAADRYIRSHPPDGPCLFEYGATFPAFLATFPPCRDLAYLPDVARLEWALNTALHADDAPPLDPAAIRAIAPEDTPRLVFRLDPSLSLLASPWPVDAIWSAQQPGADPDRTVNLDDGGVCLQVRRRGDEAGLRRLDAAAHAFRHTLGGGRSLEHAATAALAVDPAFDLAAAVAALLAEGALVGFELTS